MGSCRPWIFETIMYPVINPTDIINFVQPMWMALLFSGVFAVDVFFYLSGFLGAYLLIAKPFDKSIKNFIIVYFHRLFRLLPGYILLLAWFIGIFIYLGDGPIWNNGNLQSSVQLWKEQWWYNLLFVNNFFPTSQPMGCFGWCWYLANDMEFFMILPFQILAYKRHRYLGYITCYVILALNIFLVYILWGIYGITVSIFGDNNNLKYLYYKPWSRIGPYQVGIIFALLLWMEKQI